MTEITLTAIKLFGLYLLFTGQAGPAEAVAGVLCALVAVAFRIQVRRQAERKLHFRLRWWPRLIGQVAKSLARDTTRVGVRLVRIIAGQDAHGHEAEHGFHPGGSPQAAGRRAVMVLATSMAPETFVLDIEPHALRLHRLIGGADAVNAP